MIMEGLTSALSRGLQNRDESYLVLLHGATSASTCQMESSLPVHLAPPAPGKIGRDFASHVTSAVDEVQDQIAHQVPNQEDPKPNDPIAAHHLPRLSQHPCPAPDLLLSS